MSRLEALARTALAARRSGARLSLRRRGCGAWGGLRRRRLLPTLDVLLLLDSALAEMRARRTAEETHLVSCLDSVGVCPVLCRGSVPSRRKFSVRVVWSQLNHQRNNLIDFDS